MENIRFSQYNTEYGVQVPDCHRINCIHLSRQLPVRKDLPTVYVMYFLLDSRKKENHKIELDRVRPSDLVPCHEAFLRVRRFRHCGSLTLGFALAPVCDLSEGNRALNLYVNVL